MTEWSDRRWIVVSVLMLAGGVAAWLLAARPSFDVPSVEECEEYVAEHADQVLSEARRVAGPGAELDYLADCQSFDHGGAGGAVNDPPRVIEQRMRALGSVVARTNEGCATYLLPEEPTASCEYFEYQPKGSHRTYKVALPDSYEDEFTFSLKED